MLRNCSLEDISDGRLYDVKDMARLACKDCEGCGECCKNMGSSIILDPLDFFRLRINTGQSTEELLRDKIELNLVDGIILPNIKMGADAACPYLDADRRCSVHAYRPGVCRLFPLGRYYENGDYRYFIQKDECRRANRTKIRIDKWLALPDYHSFKAFVLKWHALLRALSETAAAMSADSDIKQLELTFVNMFYINVEAEDEPSFMTEFDAKVQSMEKLLARLSD